MGNLKSKKVIPTFNKPTAALNTGHDRAWKNVRASELVAGDIVANIGAVIYTQKTCNEEVMIEAGVPESREYFFKSDEMLYAFVKKG